MYIITPIAVKLLNWFCISLVHAASIFSFPDSLCAPLSQLQTFELCGATLYNLSSSPGIIVVVPKCLQYRAGKEPVEILKGFMLRF